MRNASGKMSQQEVSKLEGKREPNLYVGTDLLERSPRKLRGHGGKREISRCEKEGIRKTSDKRGGRESGSCQLKT